MTRTATPDPRAAGTPAPRRDPARTRLGLTWRSGALLAFAAGAAACAYLLRPGFVNDDTYAFLSWGRDLTHGYLPLLENRTFHPVPILIGAFLSLFGSAAPTLAVLLCLAGLVLAAAATWRITALLGFGQPAPILAATLVLCSPLLPVLAFVAYVNLPFATLLLWGVLFALEERSTAAWTMLVLAGLVRPEGWAFLVAYGALSWWRAGRPAAARRWLLILALSLGPMALWLALEWALFGDPLYSLRHTTGAAVQSTHSNSARALWNTLRANLTLAPLIACPIGALAVARLAPRRSATVMLGATAVAAITILVLARSNFNVPGRHFSAFVPLLCVLAAAGASTPARLLARRATRGELLAGLGGAALILAFAMPIQVGALRRNLDRIGISHDTGRTLSAAVSSAAPLIDARGARRHSVALIDYANTAQLVWLLGVPFNVVEGGVDEHTRLIVEPSSTTAALLLRHRLIGEAPPAPPAGWRLIAGGAWNFYARAKRTPVRLG